MVSKLRHQTRNLKNVEKLSSHRLEVENKLFVGYFNQVIFHVKAHVRYGILQKPPPKPSPYALTPVSSMKLSPREGVKLCVVCS